MATSVREPTLYLPAPLSHQVPILADPSKRKIWRGGRRGAKSRADLIAAILGHGPHQNGKPTLRGILQGASGVWITPDYPQARAIWREEIRPRFAGLPGIDLNETEKRVTVQGLGRLELRSAENIDSVRGAGLDFAICDEGAYFALRYALNAVILPALLDRDGWLMITSTPNAGHDGNAEKETPSYFNTLCEEVEAGQRPGWKHWHTKTTDNPALSPEAIAELRLEYPEGSPIAAQELDAELGVGAGRFYPELGGIDFSKPHYMVCKPSDLPPLLDWYEFWGGYDWGFAHPAAFGQYVRIQNTVYKLDTLYMHRYQDAEQAATIQSHADKRCLQTVYAGSDAFAKRMAHQAMAQTVADIFNGYSIRLQQANVDKLARAKALRRMFVPPSMGPKPGSEVRLVFVDTPGNRQCLQELQALVPDHLNVNVPAKRDANERGQHGDDGADETSFALATPTLDATEPLPMWAYTNVSDGKGPTPPWELENGFRMPTEDGTVDRRAYSVRRGLDSADEQFRWVGGE